jgi:hypothetical protein
MAIVGTSGDATAGTDDAGGACRAGGVRCVARCWLCVRGPVVLVLLPLVL